MVKTMLIAFALLLGTSGTALAQATDKTNEPVVSDQPITRVYKLEHRQWDDISQVLGRLFPAGYATLAYDEKGNRIIAESHDAALLDRMKQLIDTLDQPIPAPSSIASWIRSGRIRVVWLVDEGDPNGEKLDLQQALGTKGRALPVDLNDINTAVHPMGVGNLRLVGQWMARIDDQGMFDVGGTVGDAPRGITVTVTGGQRHKVGQPRADEGFEEAPLPRPLYDIMLKANKPTDPHDKNSDWLDFAKLQTVIDAPPGHPVVMGMSTTGPVTSVFVIVRYEDEPAPAQTPVPTPETGQNADAAGSPGR